MPHAEVDSLAELRAKIGVPVMLDESLCGYPDAVRAIRDGTADVLNVRLSKCGGLLPTLRIIGLRGNLGCLCSLGVIRESRDFFRRRADISRATFRICGMSRVPTIAIFWHKI